MNMPRLQGMGRSQCMTGSNLKPFSGPSRLCVLLLIGFSLSLAEGCGVRPQNPGFTVDASKAEFRITEMAARHPTLVRPLVVLSGYADPGIAPHYLLTHLGDIFADDRIIGMDFYTAFTMDECRERVIARTQQAFPSEGPNETVEVDVIAHSMGGLVSRYAAMELPGKPRLRIARLFTIATPHQGAIISRPPSLDPRVRYMQAGSGFLWTLDRAFEHRDYEMTCYTRLGDIVVSPQAAAPLGYPLWWVPSLPMSPSHLEAPSDPRILLDIVLRLCDETPVTVEPAPPLPE